MWGWVCGWRSASPAIEQRRHRREWMAAADRRGAAAGRVDRPDRWWDCGCCSCPIDGNLVLEVVGRIVMGTVERGWWWWWLPRLLRRSRQRWSDAAAATPEMSRFDVWTVLATRKRMIRMRMMRWMM